MFVQHSCSKCWISEGSRGERHGRVMTGLGENMLRFNRRMGPQEEFMRRIKEKGERCRPVFSRRGDAQV